MKNLLKIGMILGIFFCKNVSANSCTNVFPNSVQTTTAGTSVAMSCYSVLRNPGGGTVLITPSITGTTCSPTCSTTQYCTASGTTVSKISFPTFPTNTSSINITVPNNTTYILGPPTSKYPTPTNSTTKYATITVGSGSTLYFTDGSTSYQIATLKLADTLNTGASVVFEPADYWIGSLTNTGAADSTAATRDVILGSSTGTVNLYINSSLTLANNRRAKWFSAGQFTALYINGNFSITAGGSTSQQVALYAAIYAKGTATIGGSALINGALTAEGNVTFQSGSPNLVYDSTVMDGINFGTNCSTNAPTQFLVSAPSTASYCQNMTTTVTAQNASAQTVTGYVGNITLTTQTGSGTWSKVSGGGTLTNTSGGVATYQYVAADNGVASFALNYPNTGTSPATIKAYDTATPTIAGVSGAVSFSPSSFTVSVPSVTTAGTNFSATLTAGSSCGTVTSYTGAKTLRFYTTYVNPTTGTLNAKINGTAIANSSGAAQTTQSVTFTNGVATVTGNYSDVGQLNLTLVDTASGNTGQSSNFIITPYQFALNIPGNSAAQTTTPVASAVSACLADTVFKKAGAPFTVNVQAQNAQGTVTPNYGNETTPQGILLTSSALLAPSGGRNGSANTGAIGNGSTFSKVTGSGSPFTGTYFTGATFTFDEVGCINLAASVGTGSYLGAGNVTSTQVVGRFIPDHFKVSGNTPILATGCSSAAGSFTYLDKPFLYTVAPVLTVTAQSVSNTITQNYTGSFWKLANTALGNTYNKQYYKVNASDVIPALTLSAVNGSPTFVDGGNGTGTYTFSDGGGFKIQRLSGSLAPPFTAEIQLSLPTITDSDSVACTGTGCVSGGYAFGATTSGNGMAFSGTNGGKQFYHGRLVVNNAVGSQRLALTLPMQTQFYSTSGTGNGFGINTLDSCTVFSSTSNLTLTPSGVSTTASLGSTTFAQGVLNITLSAPSPVSSGYVDVQAALGTSNANLPWLQYNWPYSGASGTNYSADPRGRGTFGIYSGNDRLIYQQEVVN